MLRFLAIALLWCGIAFAQAPQSNYPGAPESVAGGAANQVWATPCNGQGSASFRGLCTGDLPNAVTPQLGNNSDDTPYILAAINAAPAGGIVQLIGATYRVCDLQIPPAAIFTLMGVGGTTIEPTRACATDLVSTQASGPGRAYIYGIDWDGQCQVPHVFNLNQGHGVNILSGRIRQALGGIGTALQDLRRTSSGETGYSLGDTINLTTAAGTVGTQPVITVKHIIPTTPGGTTGQPDQFVITTAGSIIGLSTGLPAMTQASTSGSGTGFTGTGFFGSGSNIVIGNPSYTGQSYEHVIGPAVRIDNEDDTVSCYNASNLWTLPAFNVEVYGTDNTFERFETANAFIANIYDASGGSNVYVGTHPFDYLSGTATAQYDFWFNGAAARCLHCYADTALYAGIRISGTNGPSTVLGGTYFWGASGPNQATYGVLIDAGLTDEIVEDFQCLASASLTATTCVDAVGSVGAGTIMWNNQPQNATQPVYMTQSGGTIQYRVGGAFSGSVSATGHFTFGSATGSVLALDDGVSFPLMMIAGSNSVLGDNALALYTFIASTSKPSTQYFVQTNAAPPSGTNPGYAAATSGLQIGQTLYEANDGTNFWAAAQILASVGGSVSAGIVPGQFDFLTANASGTLTEALKINDLQGVIPHLPTSCSGQASGTLWNNSSVVNVC